MHVEESFIIFHPNFDSSCRVDAMCVLVPRERIRMKRSENMTNSAARNGLKHTSALPDSKGHFKVFTTPHIHLFIIAAKRPKCVTGDGK